MWHVGAGQIQEGVQGLVQAAHREHRRDIEERQEVAVLVAGTVPARLVFVLPVLFACLSECTLVKSSSPPWENLEPFDWDAALVLWFSWRFKPPPLYCNSCHALL